MSITIQEAETIITMVRERWISLGRKPETLYMYDNHLKGAARVAETIAAKMGTINPEQAHVSALLHDVAKIDESPESMVGRFHGVLGYEMFKDRDSDVARACLLHELPWNKLSLYEKKFLGNKEDYEFVLNYVATHPMKDEDLLMQLSDGMANKDGIVTLEQRQEEYEKRFNIKMPVEMINPYKELKRYFDKKICGNVYDLFSELCNKGDGKKQIYSPNVRTR